MAYKKYLKKGGKVYGPYYYESYRDKDGNVRKKYVGTTPPKKKKSSRNFKFLWAISLVLVILLISGLAFYSDGDFGFSTTGRASFNIPNLENILLEGGNVSGSLNLNLE